LTEPAPDFNAELDAIFEGRPRTVNVFAQAKGRTKLGDFTITIEQSLPDNVEPQEDGARQQLEAAFHAAMGRTAKHVDPETGEENPDLHEAIVVEVSGDINYADAAEAEEKTQDVLKRQFEYLQQSALSGMVQRAVRPEDLGMGNN
jgi:hypothetical protein